MQIRTLGRSGLRVSPLCLGTMNFGGPTAEPEARDIVARARDAGVNFIDTADAYTGGESERIVGAAIKAERDRWVLATKVANPVGDGPNGAGTSRKWIMQAVEGSLRRLGTDFIDVYYLHKEDHLTPLAESVAALGDLIRAGKIRYFGLSNYRAWRVAEICSICDRLGIPRPVVCQPYYHALNRTAETELLPACAHFGLGVFPYSPLARGILTAKYAPGAAPLEGSRAARADKRMMETEWHEASLARAAELARHAESRATTASRLAVAWVLNNRLITGLIAGPRTMEQWEDYLAAADTTLTAADESLISAFAAPGHPSTPGYNDPAYPIEGRPTHTPADS